MLDVGERIGGMAMINNLEFVNKYVVTYNNELKEIYIDFYTKQSKEVMHYEQWK